MSTDGEHGSGSSAEAIASCPIAARIERAVPEGSLACGPAAAPCAPEVEGTRRDAPPASRPEAVAPSLAIPAEQPSPYARASAWIATHARAGAIGGATGMIAFAAIWRLDAARLVHWTDDSPQAVGALALVVGLVVGVRFGFTARAASGRERVVRALGLAPFAIAAAALALFVAVLVDSATHLSEAAAAGVTMAAAVGILLVTRLARAFAPVDDALPVAFASRPRIGLEDRRLAPLLWAGLLAASLGVFTAGVLEVLHRAHALAALHASSQKALALGLVALGLLLACSLGFTAEGRARIGRSRRVVGTLLAALFAAPALGLVVAFAASALDLRSSSLGSALLVTGLAAALVAIAGGRGVVPSRRSDRRESLALVGALLAVVCYASSTWVRYALGSGVAADDLAAELHDRGELERATSYLLIACERGVDTACAKASAEVERGRGVRADPRLAAKLRAMACDDPGDCLALAEDDVEAREPLRRRACELGDEPSCRVATLTMLQSACDARDVFACRDLARKEDQLPGGASFHAWTRACALGDSEACAHVPR